MRCRHLCARFARHSPSLLLLLLLVVVGAAPAAADPLAPPPADNSLAVIGEGQATFIHYPGTETMEVRLTGTIPQSSRITGTWAAVITGHRQQTATALPVEVLQTWSDPSYSISERFFFPADSDYGSLTVDLSYTAAGSYVVVRSVHTIEWNPVLGMNTAGVDVG